MNEKQVCKKRKCISLEVKIGINKKQKITTSKLLKEYNVNASRISTILSSKAKILEHYENNLAGPEKKHKFAYVSIDSNLAARGMLSEAEIVDSIATNNPVEQDSDAEIEEQINK
ncbi:hypothetical protein BpHYR1_012963 [Brachionus plicatilis]|uniref:HTH psq-type domain-containing protein n=1 Tax=Brachionus plicatilis TaxID=10195 RepID=A0A3M7RC13_BRAPC|nr:hypothetical protein BpHYR1_012963 [Brachionus plicatilis]